MIVEKLLSMNHLHVEGEWRRLWGMRVPPKMKHALWRAARGVLSTREVLQQRGMMVPWSCGVCGGNPENTWHLFIDCDFARDCWRESGFDQIVGNYRDASESFQEWIETVLKGATEENLVGITAVVWAIWRERNARVWRQQSTVAGMVVKGAKEALEEWVKAQELRQVRRSGVISQGCLKWHPPPPGMSKINVDAAVFATEGLTGIGMCIRDSSGSLKGYKMMHWAGLAPAREAEAYALLQALRWVEELDIRRVVFECDAKEVIIDIKR
ncbi:Putative ribonuclease H protein At1g65750 [Linum perenne]